ncbi:GbsR/MarR family transcriptional regulator [Paenibacillus validus]|uniref:GbsR/MarR family transcriptional regulator n=1 Tax=Paenibacillus TaxID=44249 RepID=UPI001F35186F|nr:MULTISPECIES: GbsR/MarR family transcriptional regulator [Paenibacillus]MED4602083.1 GbsR/MarR family transcriptional regulator [Paenibacillus validus]MED4608486.1 GbsR/MarR family transcriptional regulator [Paenibacillus validus]
MNELTGISAAHEQSIQKARKRIIESIGKNMDLYGITLSTGLLYGLMFFQNKPMTLDEMGEAMEMSKTSMSTGIRTLVDLNMVNKVWEKGSRKDQYEVERDWHQTFADFFVIKWRKAVELNLLALRKSLSELNELSAKHPEEEVLQDYLRSDIEKINQAIAYYLWLDRLIDTMESGDIYQLVPKEHVPDKHM